MKKKSLKSSFLDIETLIGWNSKTQRPDDFTVWERKKLTLTHKFIARILDPDKSIAWPKIS